MGSDDPGRGRREERAGEVESNRLSHPLCVCVWKCSCLFVCVKERGIWREKDKGRERERDSKVKCSIIIDPQ